MNEQLMTGLFLGAHPSAIEGIARLMDFAGALDEYNTSRTAELADARAIRSDWMVVGQDLRDAMMQVNGELRRSGARGT